jgi:hypothetical protein
VVLAVLAAIVAGCATPASSEAPGGEATSSVEPTASSAGQGATPEDLTAEELLAYLEAEHADEEWFAALDRLEQHTKLGSTVYELHFEGTVLEAQPLADAAFAVLLSRNLHLHGWIEAWAEGRQFAGVGAGAPVERELPAPPADIAGLRSWLALVYGPSSGREPERWYESIESIELAESAARMPLIRVDTSLPADGVRSHDDATLVVMAIAQAAPTFASDVEVWYAGGSGLLSGTTGMYVPYVY